MPASNLQGLDILHPAQHFDDSHQPFLSQDYPNLTTQLDLWTNLPPTFYLEGPPVPRHEEHKNKNAAKSITESEGEEEARSPVSGERAMHYDHVNVVTPTNVPVTPHPTYSFASWSDNEYDAAAFLGDDSLTVHRQLPTITPSLAHLLVLHPPYIPKFGAALPQCISDYAAPLSHTPPTLILLENPYVPTAQRVHSCGVSVTSTESPYFPEESLSPNPDVSLAEDKRRRNTAASVRFRLKKKEWESALKGRAKELETKVNELERECANLRKENKWLKGLVVGVTGAAQGPTSTDLTISSPPPRPLTTIGLDRLVREEPTA